MFKRNHHLRIAHILQSLNADLLSENNCLFGGGTAIVLLCDEFRESIDIDFLISDRAGYQVLRSLLVTKGMAAITRSGMEPPRIAREVRADQYGIRTMLSANDIEIKFEIVLKARIELEAPRENNRICGVKTLTLLDMAASKLLANSDRWTDDSVFSRDLIDLAMMNLSNKIKNQALEKAQKAYGESVERDLKKSIKSLGERKGRLEECMKALKIDHTPKALLWNNIRNLSK